jgi:hypothetical protein
MWIVERRSVSETEKHATARRVNEDRYLEMTSCCRASPSVDDFWQNKVWILIYLLLRAEEESVKCFFTPLPAVLSIQLHGDCWRIPSANAVRSLTTTDQSHRRYNRRRLEMKEPGLVLGL